LTLVERFFMRGDSGISEPTDAGLLRAVRRWDLVAVAINGIIGAGIFGIPSETFKAIGVYSLAAFGACAIVVGLIVLCFAEVGSRFEGTGGPYLYAREAFGSWVGFEVGWLIWIARLTAFAANLNLLVEYSSLFWPAARSGLIRIAIITIVTTALTAVNVAGVRDAARASNVFTIGKLIPLAVFIAVGLFFLNPSQLSPGAAPSFGQFSGAVLLAVYAFTGFEMAVIPAGEVKDPRRNMPMAILTALGVVTFFYLLIQVVCIGTLPGLAASTRPLADAASQFIGQSGAAFITLGALISIVGNLNVLVLAASRLPFAMGERGELPRAFAGTHSRYRTPFISIAVTTSVMLGITLSGTFVYAATISVIARLLAYGATSAALIAFRVRSRGGVASGSDAVNRAPEALFNLPAAIPIAVASLLLIGVLLANSETANVRDAAIAAVGGLIVHLLYRLWNLYRRGHGLTERSP
jgi:amino acid transporter